MYTWEGKPIVSHLCLIMSSYVGLNMKSHNLDCENHLEKGLWDIKETISVFSIMRPYI